MTINESNSLVVAASSVTTSEYLLRYRYRNPVIEVVHRRMSELSITPFLASPKSDWYCISSACGSLMPFVSLASLFLCNSLKRD